jgi:hypothetical protein
LEDKFRYTRLFSLVNDVGNDPEKEFLLKSKDWIDASPEIESGSEPDKLFPANERFLKLPNLPIPGGNDDENRLLDTSIY